MEIVKIIVYVLLGTLALGVVIFLFFCLLAWIASFLPQKKRKATKQEVIEAIDNFLHHRGGSYDWDDFLSFPIEDPSLDKFRQTCVDLYTTHPAPKGKGYCNEEGYEIMRKMVKESNSPAHHIET